MSAQMQPQVTWLTEMFLTYITYIRPLPSINAQMQPEVTWLTEMFLTYIT